MLAGALMSRPTRWSPSGGSATPAFSFGLLWQDSNEFGVRFVGEESHVAAFQIFSHLSEE